jgi:hypothetical protein
MMSGLIKINIKNEYKIKKEYRSKEPLAAFTFALFSPSTKPFLMFIANQTKLTILAKEPRIKLNASSKSNGKLRAAAPIVKKIIISIFLR